MLQFIAVCAKNGQRVELAIQHTSLEAAREDLHSQGYSIIEIKQTDESVVNDSDSVSVYYFSVRIDEKIKTGQIKANDAFKAYKKLVDDLHYEVIEIYDDPSADDEYKLLSTSKIRESYLLFKGTSEGKKIDEKKEETSKKINNYSKKESFEESPLLRKELLKYQIAIDKIFDRIDTFILQYHQFLWEERITRLKALQSSLRQIRNTTNAARLRLIGEAALIKIGELEIELLEKNKELEKDAFLTDTNRILKEVGSSKRVVLEKDHFKNKIKEFFQSVSNTFEKSQKTDESGGFIYYKNLRELQIYEEKLKVVNKEILRNFFTLRVLKWANDRLLLKKKLIIQNIDLLKKRIGNKGISYMRIIRGFSYYNDVFLYFFRSVGDFLLYAIFVYSLLFFLYGSGILFINSVNISHIFIYAITLSSVLAFSLKQVRSWVSLIVSLGFSILFIMILGVNFF